jgi:hypothetical protein
MKTSNLLLIGGAVFLGWLYFTDVKRTKDKAKSDANAQVLAEALALVNAQPQGNSNSYNTKSNTSFFGGITPQECAKLGKKYREVEIACFKAPCPSGFGVCE